jgi:hypothetical protein
LLSLSPLEGSIIIKQSQSQVRSGQLSCQNGQPAPGHYKKVIVVQEAVLTLETRCLPIGPVLSGFQDDFRGEGLRVKETGIKWRQGCQASFLLLVNLRAQKGVCVFQQKHLVSTCYSPKEVQRALDTRLVKGMNIQAFFQGLNVIMRVNNRYALKEST